MNEVLNLTDVTQTFAGGTENEHIALNHINLSLTEGEFVTIIGGNGAGKSTLLNTIAGTITPTAGSVSLQGVDLRKISMAKKARLVARVFQDPKLGSAPNLTIEENLMLAYKRGEKKKLRRALNKDNEELFIEHIKRLGLGLEDRLHTKIGLLSGGQRQALTLLMATVKTPELLLLDEHTAALDPKTAKTVMHLTQELIAEKNLTAFMITHNVQDAIKYGTRLLMVHQGNIILDFNEAEKKALTPKDVMDLFTEKSGDTLSDSQLLND